VGHQQPHRASLLIDDRARVAAGVVRFVPDDLELAPGLAAVGAAAQDEVDVPRVAAVVLAPLTEGEHGAALRGDERRDAVRVVPAVAGREERLFLDRRVGRDDGRGKDEGEGEVAHADIVDLTLRVRNSGGARRGAVGQLRAPGLSSRGA
jgi:hypothetical protein